MLVANGGRGVLRSFGLTGRSHECEVWRSWHAYNLKTLISRITVYIGLAAILYHKGKGYRVVGLLRAGACDSRGRVVGDSISGVTACRDDIACVLDIIVENWCKTRLFWSIV